LSFSGLRAASATDNPDCARSRASDALRPSPAPTISDVLYAGVIQALPDDVVLRDNDVAAYQHFGSHRTPTMYALASRYGRPRSFSARCQLTLSSKAPICTRLLRSALRLRP